MGVVPLKDDRLQRLAEIHGSARILPATVSFVDIAGIVRGASEGEGLGNKFLANIREADAICQVVRAFRDDDVVHVEDGGWVNPEGDWGDPQFVKWLFPPARSPRDPGYRVDDPRTYIDIEKGFSNAWRAWAVVVAGAASLPACATCSRTPSWFASDPVGENSPASWPRSAATRSSSARTVGSSPKTSSPTSARAIAARICGVGRVRVSERRSAAYSPIAVSPG